MLSPECRCSLLLLLLAWTRLSDGFCPIACDCNEEALSGEQGGQLDNRAVKEISRKF